MLVEVNNLENIQVSSFNSLAVRAVQKDFQVGSFLITDIQVYWGVQIGSPSLKFR